MLKKQSKPLSNNSNYVQAWAPHPYQKKAIKFLLQHGAAGLFLDPGLGKTSVCLAAVKVLKTEKLLGRVLVIAPLRVCYSVWPKELKKWTNFQKLSCSILHGSKKESALKEKADIYLINPEGLPWLINSGACYGAWAIKARSRKD